MSSMFKKTGGLSFKPKAAPRRPGAAASANKNTAQTPPADSSQASTPAPSSVPPPPALSPDPSVAPSVESSSREPGGTTQDASKETPREALPVETEKSLVRDQQTPAVQTSLQPTAIPPALKTSEVSSAPIAKPSDQVPSAPTTPSSEEATRTTPDPSAEKPSRQPRPVSIPPSTERITRPTPGPVVSAPANPPTTRREAFSPTSSVVESGTTTPVPIEATRLLTPAPSIPIQDADAPPTAPPSPAHVSDTIAVSAPVDEPPVAVPKKKAPRKRKTPTTNGDAGSEGPAPKKRRPRKKAPMESNGASPAGGGEQNVPQAKPAQRRRRRSPTPEDPENQTVDHGTTKMADLTRDLGIGKKFKHADAVEERAREARERFRQKRLAKQKRALGLDDVSASRQGTPAEGEENGRDSAVARARELGASLGSGASQTVGYEVVDGQIVINQQSLVVDRHAAHRDMSALETVEEDEFSHLTTSASYMRESRKTGPNHWTDEETEKFYRLLSMFGTDFETISAMFPEKTRRAVKLKFNREETLRPRRINATVMVRGEKKIEIDLEEYKAHQNEWEESEKILAEHDQLVREHNEDIRRLRDERRAAGLLDDDDEEDTPQKEGQDKDAETAPAHAGANTDAEAEEGMDADVDVPAVDVSA